MCWDHLIYDLLFGAFSLLFLFFGTLFANAFMDNWPLEVAPIGLFDSLVRNRLSKAFENMFITCPLGWFVPSLREAIQGMVQDVILNPFVLIR